MHGNRRQTSLPLYEDPAATTYCVLPSVAAVCQLLIAPRLVWVRGDKGMGKTALLRAVCGTLDSAQSARIFATGQPGMALSDMQALLWQPLVCVDDAHLLPAEREWQSLLFQLVDAARSGDLALVVTTLAGHAPHNLMPDIRTRLQAADRVPLSPLTLAERRTLVTHWATTEQRRIHDEALCQFITHHHPSLAAMRSAWEAWKAESDAQRRSPARYPLTGGGAPRTE